MKSYGLVLTRKAQASIMGVFILSVGITIIISLLNTNNQVIKIEKQSYLKQYNQQVLKIFLNYKIDNVSIKEILTANACGKNINANITELMNELIKPGYEYIISAGEKVFYSKQNTTLLTEINPAKITLNTYCGNNVTIISGVFT